MRRQPEPLREEPIYNPLDIDRLAESVVTALMERKVEPLPPPDRFIGAGIYAIYYSGSFESYRPIAVQNQHGEHRQPIYVGKAVPKGGRRGLTAKVTTELYGRLRQHARSISQTSNLTLSDFTCRYLAVHDIWIPLAETFLIRQYRPLWNILLDGFGNHTPGTGRFGQERSPWDEVHRGRPWAEKVQPHHVTADELLERVAAVLTDPTAAEAATEEMLGAEDDGGVV